MGSPCRLTILTQPAHGESLWVEDAWLPAGMADPGFPHQHAPLPSSLDLKPLTFKADQDCVPVHLDHLLCRTRDPLCGQRKKTRLGLLSRQSTLACQGLRGHVTASPKHVPPHTSLMGSYSEQGIALRLIRTQEGAAGSYESL